MQLTQEGMEAPPTIAGQTYDIIYIESWNAVVAECEKKLEPTDYQRALGVKNIDGFREELDKLQQEYSKDAPKHVIRLLYPALDQYEQFAQSFVKMMAHAVQVSMLWGLLYLVVKLSLESKGTIERITTILEKIGHKLRRLNQCARSLLDHSQIKGDALEINREIVVLWLNIIMMFRNQTFGTTQRFTLQSLTDMYEEAMRNIGDAIVRIENIAELAERQVRMMDLEIFQKILALKSEAPELGRIPCCVLPVAENKRFFGREDILRQIDEHLNPSDVSQGLKSMALYGLGGVGKTQIALAYGYSKRSKIDAVLWVPAENELSLQQGFTRIAIDGLKLPNAKPESHQENMVMVMTWLQQTPARWLLVYDNVESHQVIQDCWPAFDHGAILITTRHRALASQPIETGLEIKEFQVEEGAKLLVHLLQNKVPTPLEDDAAIEVSTLLNGYALAISQMAAYINARAMRIEDFLVLYKKYPKRLHRERKPGWKYVEYKHALDTVWDISFESLNESASLCLDMLSFLAPDSIPLDLFEAPESLKLPHQLSFCQDELGLWDTVEELTASALVKYNPTTRSLSLHRLVQVERSFHMTDLDRQKSFDWTITLLLSKFPNRGAMITMDHLWAEGDKYLQQIAAVANDWHDSQTRLEVLKPTIDFCNLMADAAWFVHDNDVAGIMSLVCDCGYEAFKKLPGDVNDPLLLADILCLLSIRDLTIGDFKSAEQLARQGYTIRKDLNMPEDLKMTNCYNYIALAYDSQLNHTEAKIWLDKVDAILKGSDDDLHVRLSCQNNLNSARNCYSVGEYKAAEERLDLAFAQATAFKSWYSLSYAHETYASLFSRKGEYERAQQHVILAREVLDKIGSYASVSWISGLCAYRAAFVAILQNQVQDAIDEARKATAIGRLYKVPFGHRARSTHVLFKALSMDPERKTEAEEARREAQQLRSLLPAGRTDLSDESDEAFEMLVNIIQR